MDLLPSPLTLNHQSMKMIVDHKDYLRALESTHRILLKIGHADQLINWITSSFLFNRQSSKYLCNWQAIEKKQNRSTTDDEKIQLTISRRVLPMFNATEHLPKNLCFLVRWSNDHHITLIFDYSRCFSTSYSKKKLFQMIKSIHCQTISITQRIFHQWLRKNNFISAGLLSSHFISNISIDWRQLQDQTLHSRGDATFKNKDKSIIYLK